MALTKILDIIEPSVFLQYQKEYTPEKLDLLNSSAISAPPPEVVSQMSAGGSIIDMPFWQDTDRSEPDILTDNESVDSTPKKITASNEKARKLFLGKSWSQADLAGVLATGSAKDPLAQIADYTANYWRRMAQIYAVKTMDGIRADNVANDSSDMLYSVYSDITTPLAANKISPAAVTAARLTMGEMMDDVGTIVMHSKVYGDALNQEAITFVQPSNLPFSIPVFCGMQVIKSDDCTVVAGSNTPLYRSYILGQGALAQAEHYPEMSVETDRKPAAGNGAGVTTLFNRRHMLMHVKGFSFTSSSVAGRSPTWAELQTAANWNRTRQRKNIRIAFLETN
jgi:hypothetical protein